MPGGVPYAAPCPTSACPSACQQVCKGYPSAREGLLINARFVLSQFEKLDAASGHKAFKFLETDFGQSLAKEVGGTPLLGSFAELAETIAKILTRTVLGIDQLILWRTTSNCQHFETLSSWCAASSSA